MHRREKRRRHCIYAEVGKDRVSHEPLARSSVKFKATHGGYDGGGNLRAYHVTVPGELRYTSTYTLTRGAARWISQRVAPTCGVGPQRGDSGRTART